MRIEQAETAVQHYHDPGEQPKRIAQRDQISNLLKRSMHPLTLKEISIRVDLPDSTVSGRLNELKADQLVSDDAPKRKCTVNGITKKTWRATTPDANPQLRIF